MDKRVDNRDADRSEHAPELDVLRAIAGYPVRGIHLGKQQVNSRVVLIQRDLMGRVIGSTERIEETTVTDLNGEWAQ